VAAGSHVFGKGIPMSIQRARFLQQVFWWL
jgi:hypothetical protein